MTNVVAIVAIIAALLGPLLTYLVAARKLSGRIKDSDATELWAESKSIREWSTERAKELHKEIEHLELRLDELEKANYKLMEENRKYAREIYQLRARIQHLQDERTSMANLLANEQAEVKQLKWEAEHAPRRRNSDPPVPDIDEGGSK